MVLLSVNIFIGWVKFMWMQRSGEMMLMQWTLGRVHQKIKELLYNGCLEQGSPVEDTNTLIS